MKEVDAIFRQLNSNGEIDEIRTVIADLIAEHLRRKRDSLGYWEKMHFANAIAGLARNIASRHQPTTLWLRLCLINLEKALVPPDQRNENYAPRYEELNALTYEQLVDALEVVRRGT